MTESTQCSGTDSVKIVFFQVCSAVQYSTVQYIIQFLKVMFLILTLQVPLTLPSVFSKTDSVFLKEDNQKCVFNNNCPRACISQYSPMGDMGDIGVYWLVKP